MMHSNATAPALLPAVGAVTVDLSWLSALAAYAKLEAMIVFVVGSEYQRTKAAIALIDGCGVVEKVRGKYTREPVQARQSGHVFSGRQWRNYVASNYQSE
jgi:hypothetical protein